MSQLSPDLKEEVMINIYKNTLLKSKLLRECLSEECINQLCMQMKLKKCLPEESIFDKQNIVDKLYFI
jgi:hypothetical protein